MPPSLPSIFIAYHIDVNTLLKRGINYKELKKFCQKKEKATCESNINLAKYINMGGYDYECTSRIQTLAGECSGQCTP